MTPPSFTPPSLGGGGTGGGSGSGYTPPPYSSYTPPPNWFDWNFLFQNPNYWSVADPSMLPIGTIYTPELLHLITTLGLNQAQTEWLNSNYNLQIELREWLEETEFNEYTTLGARIALELQRLGIDEGPFDEGYQNAIINNIFPNQLPSVAGLTLTIKYRKLLAANAALLKEENPTWSNWKVLWEASAESIHLLLQFGGLVPVVGEIFDFADAGLYAIQGDGKNATLSLLSGIPVAGTYFRGASMAKKALNLANGSKAVLKWYVVGNKIVFSGRGQLRKVLGLAKGDSRVAHHIIPWEWRENEVVQMAAKAGFHMNEALNGIPSIFTGNHPLYNARVAQKLADIKSLLTNSGNFNAGAAKTALEGLANDIRAVLIAHPNTPLDQLIHLF